MFTFEDLIRLDSSGVQVLMRHAEKDKLALALKGASDALKDLIFQNMSSRAGKMLKDDMESLGPVRLKDVEDAQTNLVTLTKELSNSGQITIAEGTEAGESESTAEAAGAEIESAQGSEPEEKRAEE